MRVKDGTGPERQLLPPPAVLKERLPQRRDKRRNESHGDQFPQQHAAAVCVRQAVRAQRIEDGRRCRAFFRAARPPCRMVTQPGRGKPRGRHERIKHERQGTAAEQHQRPRVEKEIRVKHGGRRSVSVVGEPADPGRKLPGAQSVRQIAKPRRVELHVPAARRILLQRRRAGQQRRGGEDRQQCRPFPGELTRTPQRKENRG